LPKFIKVKELIDSSWLGDICLVNIQLYCPPLGMGKFPSKRESDAITNWFVDKVRGKM